MSTYTERESWLAAAAVLLQHEVFPAADIDPAAWESRRYRVSCGFPIGFRGSKSGKVSIGQAFDPSISADGTAEVFINPILDEPAVVIATLAHELTHVYAGNECGHRGEFARIARAIGLAGKLTATVAGDELAPKIESICETLGAYPHAKVDPSARKKQGTRLLKLECTDCGWIVRLSAKQADRLHDESACPVCGELHTLQLED